MPDGQGVSRSRALSKRRISSTKSHRYSLSEEHARRAGCQLLESTGQEEEENARRAGSQSLSSTEQEEETTHKKS